MHRLLATFAAAALLSTPGFAQDAPDEAAPDEGAEETSAASSFPQSDIFLFDLSMDDGALSISGGENVTNRSGYDNQPFFTPDSRAFLYSRSDKNQTDIYEYDIASRTARPITQTETSEFSPVPSPDNAKISFVTDGPGANQNIAVMTRATPPKTVNLLPGDSLREPIGYYSWNHATGDVLYWSRYGFNVTLTHAEKNVYHYVSGDAVPSTPYVIPGSNRFSFVHRQGNSDVVIKAFDPETKSVTPLTSLPGANANYGWTPDGAILIIEGGVLHRWTQDSGTWDKVADLKDHGINSAARLSVSPDGTKLAIVGQAAKPR